MGTESARRDWLMEYVYCAVFDSTKPSGSGSGVYILFSAERTPLCRHKFTAGGIGQGLQVLGCHRAILVTTLQSICHIMTSCIKKLDVFLI